MYTVHVLGVLNVRLLSKIKEKFDLMNVRAFEIIALILLIKNRFIKTKRPYNGKNIKNVKEKFLQNFGNTFSGGNVVAQLGGFCGSVGGYGGTIVGFCGSFRGIWWLCCEDVVAQ
jgi:hypothetical protein